MLGGLVKPTLTKAACLSTFLGLKPFRRYDLLQTPGKFLKRNWLSFALTAPQAAYTLTGYGVVLGGLMSMVTDATWALIRSYEGKGVKIIFPRADDFFSKAARYLAQPAYHLKASAGLSYKDHWTLLAADLLAMTVIMDTISSDLFTLREETISQTQVMHFEPWEPSTVQALMEMGWRPGDPQATPINNLPENATYLDVTQNLAATLPAWLEQIQRDFPVSFSSTYFAMAFSELGAMVLDWYAQASPSTKPLFEPEEMAIAKMFEWQAFPPYQPWPEQIRAFFDLIRELMEADGLDTPRLHMIRNAVDETFGSGLPASIFPEVSGL